MKNRINRQHLDDEICKKYRSKDWDGCEAVEYFSRYQEYDPENKYANKPDIDLFRGLQDIHYGHNDAYSLVIPAYVKEEVVKRLEEGLVTEFPVPTKINNPEKYKEAFKGKVKEILENIKANKYPFQKGKNK